MPNTFLSAKDKLTFLRVGKQNSIFQKTYLHQDYSMLSFVLLGVLCVCVCVYTIAPC